MRKSSLSASEARRIALAAGGFGRRPLARVDAGAALRSIERLGLIQIDSVNIVARAHEMPLWSRLGNAFDPAMMMRLAHQERKLFEYWGHEASLIPMSSHHLLRWRQQEVISGTGNSSNKWWAKWTRSNRQLLDRVLQEVKDRGPIGASDIEMAARTEKWWGWQDERKALEWLYSAGEVVVAGRRNSFERVYDLPERVLPPEVLAKPTPEPDQARGELMRIALHACGVATTSDLADYFRLGKPDARRIVSSIVDAGHAIPVQVEGWKEVAYLDPGAKLPRSIEHATLLSPFDPIAWNRARLERLFQFVYRIEIYVPAPKRVYGYYVLPYLEDDRLCARFDLKSDRKHGVLRVLSAHEEPEGPDPTRARSALENLAAQRGLNSVQIEAEGRLADAIRGVAGKPRRRR